MPVAPQVTYPGVYIQEVPSDVRTIVPVETATTAFIGRALRGPENEPKICNSYADFERIFGGLWEESKLGYAVNQFFQNGGSKAVIVRVYHASSSTSNNAGEEAVSAVEGNKGSVKAEEEEASSDEESKGSAEAGEEAASAGDENQGSAKADEEAASAGEENPGSNGKDAGKAKIPIENLPLKAANPGVWGNELRARVTYPDDKLKTDLGKKYEQHPVRFEDLFNLTVHDPKTGATERFDNLTVKDGPRQVDKVLENESQLVAFDGELGPGSSRPTAHQAKPKEKGKSVWEDDECSKRGEGGSDGAPLDASDLPGDEAQKSGIYALEKADIFNLLCIPLGEEGKDLYKNVLADAAAYCQKRRAMLLVDPPPSWKAKDTAIEAFPTDFPGSLGNNAAIYFPRIKAPNRLRENQVEEFAPCGAIAGIFARTDAARGVWKAPAGLEATLRGVTGLTAPLTDAENGELNPRGINCLRQMPAAGFVVWGARTLEGDDQLASQWKYIPVRRTALFIEESLYRSTQWAVFEPNDEPLWSRLRLNIGVFMHGLFRQGAFQGQSPNEAYFVKCDKTTTTQADIDRGIVNIWVGFAPLKPAEFVVLYIQQIAGQLAT